MGEHNRGRRTYKRGDEAAVRRVEELLLDGKAAAELARPDVIKLYVSNLSFDATQAEVFELFSQCGPVASAHLFLDSFTGHSRGFAVVKVLDKSVADKALAMNGWTWAGRILKVQLWGRNE